MDLTNIHYIFQTHLFIIEKKYLPCFTLTKIYHYFVLSLITIFRVFSIKTYFFQLDNFFFFPISYLIFHLKSNYLFLNKSSITFLFKVNNVFFFSRLTTLYFLLLYQHLIYNLYMTFHYINSIRSLFL